MDFKKSSKSIILIAIIVAIVNFSIPYVILRDVTAYWANYIFWIFLTLVVIAGGTYYVRSWGENK